jgi:peptidyl-prolyl cis-trans isomerase D
MRFSEDGSKEKGGDLGTFAEGQMVKPFNEACFTGKKAELQIVTSQFGVHLIEVTKIGAMKEKVKIGVLETKIEASSATRNEADTKANKFAAENNNAETFDKAVADQGLHKKLANNLKKSERAIPGLETPRELVRWAWNANVGDVTPAPFEFGNKIVVAHLVATYDDGYSSIEELKEEIEADVRKEKKAEKFMDELKNDATSAGSLSELASKLGTQVDTLDHIKFTARGLPGLGRELDLIGTVFATPAGKMSAPIKGEQGVYVLQVESISEVTQPADYKQNKESLSKNMQARVGYEVYKALEKNAKVVDNRASFY